MNSNSRNAFGSNSSAESEPPLPGEATLRLIAQLAPPEGLEERVLANLRTAPRSGRVLSWRRVLQPSEGWMRSAAAAAIVSVVVGGGWSIYLHVQPPKAGATLAAPAKTGGFSSAGAMRTPETVTGPMITKPADDAKIKPEQKTDLQSVPAPHHKLHKGRAHKTGARPAAATVR